MGFGIDPVNLMDLVVGNVTRPYKFNCSINLPDPIKNAIGLYTVDAAIKATTLPAMKAKHLELKQNGRTIRQPLSQEFPGTWEVTFYLGELMFFRQAMEKWVASYDNFYDGLNDSSSMLTGIASAGAEFLGVEVENVSSLYSTATVTQYSNLDTGIQEYEFIDLFPISISPVQLGDDMVGQVNEFTVEFAYNHYNYYKIKDSKNMISKAVGGYV